MSRRWTSAELEIVRANRLRGVSVRDIGKLIDRTRNAVACACTQYGWHPEEQNASAPSIPTPLSKGIGSVLVDTFLRKRFTK